HRSCSRPRIRPYRALDRRRRALRRQRLADHGALGLASGRWRYRLCALTSRLQRDLDQPRAARAERRRELLSQVAERLDALGLDAHAARERDPVEVGVADADETGGALARARTCHALELHAEDRVLAIGED